MTKERNISQFSPWEHIGSGEV